MSGKMSRGFAAIAAGLLLAAAQMASAQTTDATRPSAEDRALLKDAIDIHSHLEPDSFGPHSGQGARSLDVIDMAERTKASGMRGFVHKEHYDQTAQLAYLARKVVPGVEVFGQLCLNLTVGGLNPEAVYHFSEVKGGFARIVSMPTWDSANNVGKSRDTARPSVAVSRGGELLPEAKAIIGVIANTKMRDTGASFALATGHISAEEVLMVVREARKQGIERIVVTHATGHPVEMNLAQMKEAVAMGAYIEFAGAYLVGEHAPYPLAQSAAMIRELGVDHVILSSDAGQVGNLYPDDMIATMAGALRKQGMTEAELHKMTAENPARLLGLPLPEAQ